MTAAVTLTGLPAVLVLMALVTLWVGVPVWLLSRWARDRLQERIKAHYDRKLAELEAEWADEEETL